MNVYKAAELWVERALKSDDSLFTPGVPIWSSEWLGELRERFLNQPDAGSGSFDEKLQQQLLSSPPQVYQLMGEVLYFYFLIVSTKNSDNEKRVIDTVLGWSESRVTIPPDLVASLTPGIVSPGQVFHTSRPFQVGFLIEFVEQWKDQETDTQHNLLTDPWQFKGFAAQLEFRSELLRDYPNRPRSQREAMLHLVFPDTFEGITSVDRKEKIAAAFEYMIVEPTDDVDRKLEQIRRCIESELGRNFDFHDGDVLKRWDRESSPWDEYVRRAQKYVYAERLDSEEINYKIEIGRKLAMAREATLAGAGEWGDIVKRELPSGNPLAWQTKDDFCRWIGASAGDALQALQAIWTQGDLSVTERIHAFSDLFPKSVISGAGTRARLVSVLLMGLRVQDYPPFGASMFNKAYRQTQYHQPEQGADEAALYVHALGFLDRFTEEAAERGLELRHRLDAQSLVWALNEGRDGPHSDLQALSQELNLPVKFLEDVQTLLGDKKQVIFQGPPGTGKTYVAQKFAECLAESKERITLVQFHPSYTYEDFVQGFRPTLKDGQPGFALRDGPLLQAAERARNDSDGKQHFLIIDEINRGNLAKILGELYFLLEYRDEEISLQYSDKRFSLPDNLSIIGTMNTADRSIALVDLALRRRFYFVEFRPDEWPVKELLRKWLGKHAPGMEWVADVVDLANERLGEDRHAAIGPSYFMKPGLDETTARRAWKHGVLPYIEERLFGQDDRLGEFDFDALRGEVTRGGADDESEETNDNDAEGPGGGE